MNPRKLLDVAKRLLTRSAEEDWRTAANRSYYAVLLICRDVLAKWGFFAPITDKLHSFVRVRFFLTPNSDLMPIGRLGTVLRLRCKNDEPLRQLSAAATFRYRS